MSSYSELEDALIELLEEAATAPGESPYMRLRFGAENNGPVSKMVAAQITTVVQTVIEPALVALDDVIG